MSYGDIALLSIFIFLLQVFWALLCVGFFFLGRRLRRARKAYHKALSEVHFSEQDPLHVVGGVSWTDRCVQFRIVSSHGQRNYRFVLDEKDMKHFRLTIDSGVFFTYRLRDRKFFDFIVCTSPEDYLWPQKCESIALLDDSQRVTKHGIADPDSNVIRLDDFFEK